MVNSGSGTDCLLSSGIFYGHFSGSMHSQKKFLSNRLWSLLLAASWSSSLLLLSRLNLVFSSQLLLGNLDRSGDCHVWSWSPNDYFNFSPTFAFEHLRIRWAWFGTRLIDGRSCDEQCSLHCHAQVIRSILFGTLFLSTSNTSAAVFVQCEKENCTEQKWQTSEKWLLFAHQVSSARWTHTIFGISNMFAGRIHQLCNNNNNHKRCAAPNICVIMRTEQSVRTSKTP